MLGKLILNQLIKSTLEKLKGKKRWLAIIALVVAYVAQALGLDFGADLEKFIADVINIIQSAED